MRIRNYSNTLSYEVITMALRTARRTVPDNGYSSQYLSDCRGSQAVGETGVSQLLGVGVIAGSLGLGACIHFHLFLCATVSLSEC